MNKIILGILVVIVLGLGFFVWLRYFKINTNLTTQEKIVNQSIEFNNERSNSNSLVSETKPVVSWQSPLDRPSERISKKTFGQYITSANSPVQPERFAGYHTGVDFEIFESELESDVTVSAFCEGSLRSKRTVSGYGGLVVQDCTLDNQVVTVVYGHLRLTSIVTEVGNTLLKGEVIGQLGAANSTDTDGERKHLHFGIHKGSDINIKGYVSFESELSSWLDPLDYL